MPTPSKPIPTEGQPTQAVDPATICSPRTVDTLADAHYALSAGYTVEVPVSWLTRLADCKHANGKTWTVHIQNDDVHISEANA